MLYEEALYTVVYRSGVVSSEHTANEDKLFEYLQKVRQYSWLIPVKK